MKRRYLILISSTVLAGCGTPFGERVVYDRSVANVRGTITISDPKLYPREALIQERQDDVNWIKQKMVAARSAVPKPAIQREVETITAFSAAASANIDPAAGAQFKRDEERREIQQRVDLKKQLFEEEKLDDQIEAYRNSKKENLGDPADPSAAPNVSPADPATIDTLQSGITEQIKTLKSLLDVNAAVPKTPDGLVPSDAETFRYQLGLLDEYKSALNAARLDSLHDLAGKQLVRLNFRATAIPEPDYIKGLGVVQMHIRPPSREDARKVFLDWLNYINRTDKERSLTEPDTFSATGAVADLRLVGDFSVRVFEGREVLLPETEAVNSFLRQVSAFEGFDPQRFEDSIASWRRTTKIKVEKQEETEGEGTAASALKEKKPYPFVDDDGWTVVKSPEQGRKVLRDNLDRLCSDGGPSNAPVVYFGRKLSWIDENRLLWKILSQPSEPENVERFRALRKKIEAARREYSALQSEARSVLAYSCVDREVAPSVADSFDPFIDQMMGNAAGAQARVYEVGPKEQVHQISTVARSANSLALAASLSAAAPGAGVKGNAAANYSRSAAGRAAALERVPAVVGYAQSRTVTGLGSTNTTKRSSVFGWVFGPTPVLDPKGNVLLEQQVTPHDLSVDLAVPGWWTEFSLGVDKVWAPSPTQLATGSLGTALTQEIVPVQVAAPQDAFESVSAIFSLLSLAPYQITETLGGPLSECSATQVLVKGKNLWRTERVMVFRQSDDATVFANLTGSAIALTPDMDSVIVTIPKVPETLGFDAEEPLKLLLMSPRASSEASGISFRPKPSNGQCPGVPKKEDKAEDKKGDAADKPGEKKTK
ncbi:MAG: hypothetical protein AAF249_13425 [Pseudomonadota bacterium]